MRSKERLCWAVAGGVLFGIIIGLCISPLTAQDGNFGEITCTGLKVVDANGIGRLYLSSGAGDASIRMESKNGLSSVMINVSDRTSLFHIGQSNEHVRMYLDGLPTISVLGANGAAEISLDKYGGKVALTGRGDSKGKVIMGVNEYGNGAVSTWDKNGYRQ